MVRRLLLASLLAVLAVALPAGAEGELAPATGPEPSGPSVCPPLDLACLPTVNETGSQAAAPVFGGFATSDQEGQDVACRVFDFTNDADPLRIVDPDGCWWRFIRRTLGIGMETPQSLGGWAARPPSPALPVIL